MKYQIRHTTLSSVITEVENIIKTKGYNVPECFTDLGYFSHVEYGTTQRYNEKLSGEHKRDNGIAFQIYRCSRGNYELNMYFWK
jgi:hypothetical protein